MNAANILMFLGALLAFSAGSASADPCNTVSRDAGSGNVPGYTGQTIATATDSKHPPTSVMNKATENIATSSQDAQRQMQGQPTAAGQSRQNEATPSEQSPKMQPAPSEKKPAGEDC
jgi:hypothetical protein